MPDLFNFSKEEIKMAGPEIMMKLNPQWYRGSKQNLV
jgi:hypothetical protein